MRRIAQGFALLGALIVAAVAAIAAPTFPALTGRVVDEAGIIPADTERDIEGKLEALEARTTDQFVVVTVKSLQGYEIQDFGVQLGRAWGIGQKDKDNGVVLLIAPNERKVGFQVGYGLEGTLTDALTQVIIQSAILPRFRANDMAGGIARGVDDTIQVLSGEAEEIQQLAEKRPADESPWAPILPFLIILVLSIILTSMRRRGRRAGVLGSILGAILAGSSSSSSSGRSWSGGSSSGGFSGGGGSFGGGGSSGSW
jgi:uncharacterized protein